MRKPDWYYKLRYGILEGKMIDVRIAMRFIKLAFLSLFGKATIIDTEEVFSNGGFKFKTFIVSRLPVSSKHRYDTI